MNEGMMSGAIVVMTTLVAVALTVALHYEGLDTLNKRFSGPSRMGHRAVVVIVFWLVALHVAEIWLFGLAYWVLVSMAGIGAVTGGGDNGILEMMYLSATTYSTVGFGDVAPEGHVRFLAGTEALLGLILITWSASFTYLEMSRRWNDDDSRGRKRRDGAG